MNSLRPLIQKVRETTRRMLREPLLHFVVLGGALFGLYQVVSPASGSAPDTIMVDADRVRALVAEHQRVWQRPPSTLELRQLIDSWIREEVLFREGVSMGMDRDDTVVRRRVVQKMTFFAEGLGADVPSDEDVRTWFESHADAYKTEPTTSLSQVYFDPSKHAADLDAVVASARAALERDPAVPLGDATLLPRSLEEASQSEVTRVFGEGFAKAVATLAEGQWLGPVTSGFGVHLVRVEAHTPTGLPKLEQVRKAVERDLSRARTQEASEAFYRAARARYEVRVEEAAATTALAAGEAHDEGGT